MLFCVSNVVRRPVCFGLKKCHDTWYDMIWYGTLDFNFSETLYKVGQANQNEPQPVKYLQAVAEAKF